MSTRATSTRAIITDPSVPGHLALEQVAAPEPAAHEALVQVRAISLNRGEVRSAMNNPRAGTRLGWDLAGTVERTAADGSGPPEGSRVVGFMRSGAWAERVAVPTQALAVLPDEVSFAQAATLPVAGLTALYALEKGGSLLGRPVLITGATGGVGHLAVQLAQRSGASVTTLVRREEQRAIMQAAGATHVAVSEDAAAAAAHGPYHLVLESVGGQVLSQVLTMLAKNGTCVTFGASGGAQASLDVGSFYGKGGGSLYGFILFHELEREPAATGLARLGKLVASGDLKPHIALEASWTEVGRVAQGLMARSFSGKAVLHVGD